MRQLVPWMKLMGIGVALFMTHPLRNASDSPAVMPRADRDGRNRVEPMRIKHSISRAGEGMGERAVIFGRL